MEEKPNYYAIIPAEVRYDKDLRANEKILYSEIVSLTQKTGECWASNKYFAELYSVKENAIAVWIRHLKTKGYIQIEYKLKGKEIQQRIIKIGGIQKDSRWYSNEYEGIHKKIPRGIQKDRENNKYINNTSNNNINICPKCTNLDQIEQLFNEFWKAYPRKVKKAKCEEWYKKHKVDKKLHDAIMFGLSLTSIRDNWKEIEKEFIPHPLTFLNQKRWEDFNDE